MSELRDLIENLNDEKVIEIMANLGADEYKNTDNAIIFKTICHHHDQRNGNFKLYYYKNSKLFVCYSCCGTFNIIELFKKRYELLNIQYDFYKDIVLKLGGGTFKKEKDTFYQPYEPLYEPKKNNLKVSLKHFNKGVLNAFTFYPTQEWLNDGIGIEAMKNYNILYSIEENKIIIPHYDIDNNLIGIRCRPLNEEDLIVGKYLPITIEGTNYAHPLGYNLYGLNLVKNNIKKYKMAIVAEGEKAALQYETMFGKDRNIVVAACGSNFSKYQLDLLLKCGAEKVLLAFDKEGETWKEKEKYFSKLKAICERYKNYCSLGFIYDNSGLLKLKQSPFDCGADIAAKLISKGVWI